MQKILKEWRNFYRQGSNLFFCILFPTLLTFLLGSLLEGLEKAEYDIGSISLAYVETEEAEGIYLAEFLKGVEEIALTLYRDKESALEDLQKGSVDAVCGYEVKDEGIFLYQGKDTLKGRALENILTGYSSVAAAVKVSGHMPEAESRYVISEDLGIHRNMMDYYAVVMLVLVMFMGSMIGGATVFYEERVKNTMMRTALAPIGKTKVFLAIILGQIPQILLQIFSIMFCSSVFFGARYCGSWQENVLFVVFCIVISLTLVTIGTLLGLLIPRNPIVFIMPVLWIMMTFSGTFSKEIYVKGITEWMPVYQIQQAAFDLTMFGRQDMIWKTMEVSILILLICLGLGGFIYNRKKGW